MEQNSRDFDDGRIWTPTFLACLLDVDSRWSDVGHAGSLLGTGLGPDGGGIDQPAGGSIPVSLNESGGPPPGVACSPFLLAHPSAASIRLPRVSISHRIDRSSHHSRRFIHGWMIPLATFAKCQSQGSSRRMSSSAGFAAQ